MSLHERPNRTSARVQILPLRWQGTRRRPRPTADEPGQNRMEPPVGVEPTTYALGGRRRHPDRLRRDAVTRPELPIFGVTNSASCGLSADRTRAWTRQPTRPG